MRQTILSVTLEVKPASAARLSAVIDDLHARAGAKGATQSDYGWFMTGAPSVHFLSMNVFPASDYDPVFVLEANFDGAPGPFWAELESVLGAELRAILRCCKQPLDEDGPLFAAIVAPGSGESLAPYFERRAAQPSVFHQGNRGMTRGRVLAERDLFLALREALPTCRAGSVTLPPSATANEVHQLLRATLSQSFPWLDQQPPARVNIGERMLDWIRLISFALAALLLLALPGLLLASAAMAVHTLAAPTPSAVPRHLRLMSWGAGIASIAVMLAGIFAWLRYLEKRDSAHDAPAIDPLLLRDMAAREDRIPQNHMGSIVMLKPGVLRTIIVHAGHRALHLALRAVPASGLRGYLGSMRTVHFAHWAFVNNGGRLMFFSNFDHSWESYLDDFIEKAHVGLTLAWGCGVGFPPTRWLIMDGASYGTRFKNWARHSMVVSRFWYSAYPDLTVDQIERNNRIANGLRKQKLSPAAAAAWIEEL